MTTTYGDVQKQIIFVYADGTEKVVQTTISNGYSVWKDASLKQSVDTGKFERGVFRINPYLVTRTHNVPIVSCVEYDRPYTSGDIVMIKYRYEGDFLSYSGMISTMEIHYGAERAVDVAKLLYQRARGNCGSANLDGLTELGELKETMQMLRNPLKELRDLLGRDNSGLARRLMNHYRNPREFIRDAKKLGSTASNTWLECRYGIRPLLGLIADIMDMMKSSLEEASVNRIYRKRSRQTLSDTQSVVGWRPNQGSVFDTIADCNGKTIYKCQGVAYYRRIWDQNPAEALGLTPSHIPETVWELLRLSFVVDWIYGIGPWLSAMRFQPGIIMLGGCSSVRTEHISVATGKLYLYTDQWKDCDPAVLFTDTFQRFDQGDSVGTPIFRGASGLDYVKAVDSCALIYQAILATMKKR